jgi:hypothetical protein
MFIISAATDKSQCRCCGKRHEAAKLGEKADTSSSAEKVKEIEITDADRAMIRMKEEKSGRPWSEIAEASGFPNADAAKARYKEINDAKPNKAEDHSKEEPKKKEKGKKKGKEKVVDPDKEADNARKREEGLKKQAEKGPGKKSKEPKDAEAKVSVLSHF